MPNPEKFGGRRELSNRAKMWIKWFIILILGALLIYVFLRPR